MSRTDSEAAADRERAELDARRRAAMFATLGQPRPVLVVAAGPRPAWVAPIIPPPRVRGRTAPGPRKRTPRPAATPGKCTICRIRDVKPPRVLRGRSNAGQIKTHKTCQPCIDERVEFKKRKRAKRAAQAAVAA